MIEFCDAQTEYDGEPVSCSMPLGHPEAHSAKIWWE